jgi:hypothetical protein
LLRFILAWRPAPPRIQGAILPIEPPTFRTSWTSAGPIFSCKYSRVHLNAGMPQLKAIIIPSGAQKGTPTPQVSLSHSPIEMQKPRSA